MPDILDASEHQDVNWIDHESAGYDIAIVRTNDGDHLDRAWMRGRPAAMRNAGVTAALYAFGRVAAPSNNQRTARQEVTLGLATARNGGWKHPGGPMGIYTDPNTLSKVNPYLTSSDRAELAKCYWWIASWGVSTQKMLSQVRAIAPWIPWEQIRLHQFTSSGRTAGTPGRVDLNRPVHPKLGLPTKDGWGPWFYDFEEGSLNRQSYSKCAAHLVGAARAYRDLTNTQPEPEPMPSADERKRDRLRKRIARERRKSPKDKPLLRVLWRRLARVLRKLSPQPKPNFNGRPQNVTDAVKRAIVRANRHGLYVTSTTGGRHASRSWHYSGNAVDVAGSYSNMVSFQRDEGRRGNGHYHELFGPDAWYIKNGSRYGGRFPHHGDHVHVAPRD